MSDDREHSRTYPRTRRTPPPPPPAEVPPPVETSPPPAPETPTPTVPDSSTPPQANKRIVVDPITRIEGHLKIETEVENGKVVGAWSTGTLFRGIETILEGRNPEDAWLFTQRLCGVCTYVHGSTSVRCVEDAAGVDIPDNARIVRNLLMGAQYLHDHLVHFYHLHALDWVDVVSALSADPAATADLAETISPAATEIDFAAIQSRLQNFVDGGQLGPFANAYWAHPAYKLTAEANLLLTAHYLEALRMQAKTARLHAIFGGKNPHVQSLRVGGVTCQREINGSRINEFRALLWETQRFIDTYYVPDVTYLAAAYPDWSTIGGNDNFLAVGEFPQDGTEPQSLFFPRGVIYDRGGVQELNTALIEEHVKHSWYKGETPLHPSVGETTPSYTGMNTADRYSWLKAPRYDGWPMEVGPLARMLVAYGSDDTTDNCVALAQGAINSFLISTGLPFSAMFSVLGRVAARALETQIIAGAMGGWLDELTKGIGRNAYQPTHTPVSGVGMGLNEAPRGALGHWIDIQNQKIGNYQMVVPSTWNFGPRCAAGKAGPVEQALVGVPVIDAAQPLEILRTVHSLDPCIACAVHVIDPENDRAYEIKVL